VEGAIEEVGMHLQVVVSELFHCQSCIASLTHVDVIKESVRIEEQRQREVV
jgi:hypothetical protein